MRRAFLRAAGLSRVEARGRKLVTGNASRIWEALKDLLVMNCELTFEFTPFLFLH